MNKFGKFLLCLSIPALMASTGCAIYYGIEYHNLDKQVIEDDSGMVNVVDELRKSVASLETEKANLTQQLTLLQEQYDALNQLRQNLENTNNTLETENAELQTQIEELNTQNEQLETQITNLNNQITSLNTQIETLNKTLEDNKSASDEEIASLQVQVTTLQAQVNSLNSTIDNLNNELDSYEANTIALNTEIANLNNTIDEYEQEIENYKRIIEELKKINSCVVTFIVDGQVVSTQQVNKTESPVAIDTPTSESYIFDGWTISGSTEIVDPFTYSVVEDMEFVASIRKYKVITFTVDDEVVSTQSIITDSELQLPDEPTKEHYSFLGWSLDGENVIDLTSYSFTQDTNLIAIFEVVGQLAYTFDGNTLTGYTGTDEEIIIPKSYTILEEGVYVEGDDILVTAIGNNAFQGNLIVNSVILNENITSIGNNAFYGCKNVTSFIITNNVTNIGSQAFYNCTGLTTLTIGEGVKTIGGSAFYNTTALREIYFNAISMDNIQSYSSSDIGLRYVAEGCIAYIGKQVTRIPNRLFMNSSSYPSSKLSKVVFEEGSICEYIGQYAFYYCNYLTEINLPDTITNIGSSSFEYCNKLTEIKIGENVTTLGNRAFYCCIAVKNVYYNAKSIASVGMIQSSSDYGVFYGVHAENLYVGKSVEFMPNYLFHGQYQYVRVSFDNVEFEDGCVLNSIGYNNLYNTFSYCEIGTITISEQNIYDILLSGNFFKNGVSISTYIIKSEFVDASPVSTLENTSKYTKTIDGDYCVYTKVTT